MIYYIYIYNHCITYYLPICHLLGHHRGVGAVLRHPRRHPRLRVALRAGLHAPRAELDAARHHGQGVPGATTGNWNSGKELFDTENHGNHGK